MASSVQSFHFSWKLYLSPSTFQFAKGDLTTYGEKFDPMSTMTFSFLSTFCFLAVKKYRGGTKLEIVLFFFPNSSWMKGLCASVVIGFISFEEKTNIQSQAFYWIKSLLLLFDVFVGSFWKTKPSVLFSRGGLEVLCQLKLRGARIIEPTLVRLYWIFKKSL